MSESDYMERIHELPCVICWKKLGIKTYGVHAHHAGDAPERNSWALIPLCSEHHQGATGIHGLRRLPFYRFWKTNNNELLGWTNEANAKF